MRAHGAGMDRWSLRVAAYAGLMTDAYLPFRLDQGGTGPCSVPAGPRSGRSARPRGVIPRPPPAISGPSSTKSRAEAR
jgi:hypothetical protein